MRGHDGVGCGHDRNSRDGCDDRDDRNSRDGCDDRDDRDDCVDRGRPTAPARSSDWQAWGATCGASSCASSVPGIEHQWRSGLGITPDGALVYAEGPALAPAQLAALLVRAGAVRGMELDINPDWPVFATYRPAGQGRASPADGQVLMAGVRGADTFFEPWWARDFITLSARILPPH